MGIVPGSELICVPLSTYSITEQRQTPNIKIKPRQQPRYYLQPAPCTPPQHSLTKECSFDKLSPNSRIQYKLCRLLPANSGDRCKMSCFPRVTDLQIRLGTEYLFSRLEIGWRRGNQQNNTSCSPTRSLANIQPKPQNQSHYLHILNPT